MNIKKKVVGISLSAMFVLSSIGTVFAAEPVTSATPVHNSNDSQYEAKLVQEAQAQGITVDQLKAKNKAEHETKLEQEAKAKGITVDQLKAQLKDKKKTQSKQTTKKKSVKQPKAQLKAKHNVKKAVKKSHK